MRLLRPLIIAALLLIGAAPALAGNPAGEAVSVAPQASGTLNGASGSVPMASGDGVFLGQTIVTADTGQVQIVFSDDTHLVIGPGSSLVISQYLMRNDGSLGKFVIDLLGGTFRFLTGDSDKDAYEINTPTGQIAVRGTAFDLGVAPDTGTTTLLLYHGGVRLCGAAGCKTMSDPCSVGQIAGRLPAKVVAHSDGRRTPLLAAFPYLRSQSSLQRGFRIGDTAACRQTKIDDAFGVSKPRAPDKSNR